MGILKRNCLLVSDHVRLPRCSLINNAECFTDCLPTTSRLPSSELRRIHYNPSVQTGFRTPSIPSILTIPSQGRYSQQYGALLPRELHCFRPKDRITDNQQKDISNVRQENPLLKAYHRKDTHLGKATAAPHSSIHHISHHGLHQGPDSYLRGHPAP